MVLPVLMLTTRQMPASWAARNTLTVPLAVMSSWPSQSPLSWVNAARWRTVQAGAFGEHQFTTVQHGETTVNVDGKYFEVSLPPSTSVRIQAGLRRFANDPSYAFSMARRRGTSTVPVI